MCFLSRWILTPATDVEDGRRRRRGDLTISQQIVFLSLSTAFNDQMNDIRGVCVRERYKLSIDDNIHTRPSNSLVTFGFAHARRFDSGNGDVRALDTGE